VPARATVVGDPVALLAIFTLAPATVPPVVGLNVTVSVAAWPGLRIRPFATPLELKPAPVVVTLETVTLEFPVLVMVEVSELDVFRLTVPKFKLVGFAVRVRVAATAVPFRLMVSGEGVPFVVSVTEPLTLPADAGVNTALNVNVAPAAIVLDVVRPLMLIPAPVTETLENVSVVLPLFFSWIGWELLLPTTTLENVALAGLAATCACTPVPLSEIVAGDPGALLVIEMLPLELAAVVGVNVTVNWAFAPALIDFGAVRFIV